MADLLNTLDKEANAETDITDQIKTKEERDIEVPSQKSES